MPRLRLSKPETGKYILLIDDQEDYIITTKPLLEREGHNITTATSGEEGLKLLKEKHFDLLLLDYYMPGGITGEDVVKNLRTFNPYIQIILQTGYSGDYPPREMLQRLDIQGYHDKSDGPDKLLMWVDVGLKAAYTVQLLYKSRQGLRFILDVTPDLHKIQPLEELLQGILLQISGLLGTVNSFLAVIPENINKEARRSDGYLAIIEEEKNFIIRAATGRYSSQKKINRNLDSFHNQSELYEFHEILKTKIIKINENSTIVPLCAGDQPVGIIFLDQNIKQKQDIELLQIFANQAAVAIQNTRLYEMATLDPLTGVFARRFFNQWLLRELRICFRSKNPLSLLMIDMDGLKAINDAARHLMGDQALTILGKVLRQATRNTDFVGRLGGDEFAVLLPFTSAEGAELVSNRILELLKDKNVDGPSQQIPIHVSIGIGIVGIANFEISEIARPVPYEYFDGVSKLLLQKTDDKLYQSKRSGGNCIYINDPIEWPDIKNINPNEMDLSF